MLDAFTKVVAQADAQGTFASNTQIDALKAMVADGTKRIDVVNRITSNSSAIVANAARALFDDQPNLIAPGGNAYTNRRMAACLRDMEIVLRYLRSLHWRRFCPRRSLSQWLTRNLPRAGRAWWFGSCWDRQNERSRHCTG
jgi:hypothetical protein